MYFPPLRRLGQYQISGMAIDLLDDWLAIQRKAVLANLSPIKFSIQTEVDTDLAIDMFALASLEEIGVLRAVYKVICPHCDRHNGSYSSLSVVPNNVCCKDCERIFNPHDRLEYVEIFFERTLEPNEPLVNAPIKKYEMTNSGNAQSLRVSDVVKKPSSARRHLFTSLDNRYEAAQ
ncbi:hypothetical protein [Paenibacillus sp. MBLB4367]|uniref:hypothetical protein n=1 Tax=Paenibacillus sp. MBLB4367 TaxID=3384767 RepID=UPI003908399F